MSLFRAPVSPRSAILAVCLALIAAPAAFGGDYLSRRLPGGPLVVVRPDDAVPAAAVTAIVGAGAIDEGPGMVGASHFLEHLCFNGTTSRTQEELYRETDRLGLYNNAFTRREFTAYQLLGPSNRLPQMFELQADMLFHSTLPEEKFEKERGIVLEEIAKNEARRGNGDAEVFEAQVLLAHRATGTPESIAGLKRERVLDYYERRYRPGNVVLYVTGDVDPEQVFRLARQHYKSRGRRRAAVEAERLALDFAPPGSAPRRVELSEEASVRSWLVFPAPAPREPGLVRALVFARALSELAQAEWGRGASAWVEVSRRSPVLVLAGPVSVLELEAWAAKATLDLDALDRTARAIGAAEVLQAEQPHYHAFYRASMLSPGDVEALEELAALPSSLDAEATLAWGARLLGGPRLAVEGGAASEPQEAQTQAAPVRAVAAGGTQTQAHPAAPAGPELLRRGDSTLGREVLPNGLVLLTESSPGHGVFAATVLLRDKDEHERRWCLPGAAEVLHRTFSEGTQLREGAELAADLEMMGAELKTVDIASLPYDDYALSPEYGYVRAKVPAGAGDELLPLLAEFVSWPALDEERVALARKAAISAVARGRRGGREAAGQAFQRELLGEPPWPARGTSAALAEIDAEALAGFAADYLAPANTVLAVVSDRPHHEIARQVRRQWRSAGRGLGEVAEAPEARDCDPRFDAEPDESAQVWMYLGQQLSVPAERAAALRAGNAWLKARVAFVVREELGLAYAVGTALDPRGESPGWFRVALGTRPENVERATEAARRAVREALAGVIDPADWDAAVHGGAGRKLMRSLPSDNRAFQAALAEFRGEVFGEVSPVQSEVAPAEALTVLREALQPETWTLVVGRWASSASAVRRPPSAGSLQREERPDFARAVAARSDGQREIPSPFKRSARSRWHWCLRPLFLARVCSGAPSSVGGSPPPPGVLPIAWPPSTP